MSNLSTFLGVPKSKNYLLPKTRTLVNPASGSINWNSNQTDVLSIEINQSFTPTRLIFGMDTGSPTNLKKLLIRVNLKKTLTNGIMFEYEEGTESTPNQFVAPSTVAASAANPVDVSPSPVLLYSDTRSTGIIYFDCVFNSAGFGIWYINSVNKYSFTF